MQKLKVNDEVVVIAGKDRGKKGKIKTIYAKQSRIVVENVNIVKKNIKPTKENPNGGVITKENPVHRSNIALVDPKNGKATKVKISVTNGKAIRIAKSSGVEIGK
ncbi:MAG: 50S ribosomal protein L24 [Oligoflexia bacterium]|nr:50S ribosomal protein L24 [Oligoflexia bacterium]